MFLFDIFAFWKHWKLKNQFKFEEKLLTFSASYFIYLVFSFIAIFLNLVHQETGRKFNSDETKFTAVTLKIILFTVCVEFKIQTIDS